MRVTVRKVSNVGKSSALSQPPVPAVMMSRPSLVPARVWPQNSRRSAQAQDRVERRAPRKLEAMSSVLKPKTILPWRNNKT